MPRFDAPPQKLVPLRNRGAVGVELQPDSTNTLPPVQSVTSFVSSAVSYFCSDPAGCTRPLSGASILSPSLVSSCSGWGACSAHGDNARSESTLTQIDLVCGAILPSHLTLPSHKRGSVRTARLPRPPADPDHPFWVLAACCVVLFLPPPLLVYSYLACPKAHLTNAILCYTFSRRDSSRTQTGWASLPVLENPSCTLR